MTAASLGAGPELEVSSGELQVSASVEVTFDLQAP